MNIQSGRDVRIMSLLQLSNYNIKNIHLGTPRKCRNDGKFYQIRYIDEVGQKVPLCLGTSYSPIRTYGINQWGSIFLYVDPNKKDDGLDELLQILSKIETDVETILRGQGVTAKVSSRISNRPDDTVRISAKPLCQPGGVIAPVIKDLEEKVLTKEELMNGDAFDMYPVIKLDSVFVNKSKGIILQLRISEAFVHKLPPRKSPKLDLMEIRKRYQHVHLLRCISFENQEGKRAEIEE